MNKILVLLASLIVLAAASFFALNSYIYNEKQADAPENTSVETDTNATEDVQVLPISHATFVLKWESAVIYNDPTGGAGAFTGHPEPTIILISDVHGDHLNVETLQAITTERTIIIAPQAVADQLPETLPGTLVVLKNGETTTQEGIFIEAIPMYNLPESPDSRHTKGRGNGYVLEASGKRIYIAGDTAGTPEMRSLTTIDMAFIPMNPPFTMTVEEAAEAVLDFEPKKVYPYHYRGQGGSSDINHFKELIEQGSSDTTVILLNWYPES